MHSINPFDTAVLAAIQAVHTPWTDHAVLTFTQGWLWVPMYVVLLWGVVRSRGGWRQALPALTMVAVVMAVCAAGTDLVMKPLVARQRPWTLAGEPGMAGIVRLVMDYRPAGYSFPSAHSANSMAVALLASGLLRRRWLAVVLISWALLMGLSRIYLAAHWPTDVVIGWVWGGVMGCGPSIILPYRGGKATGA